MARPPHSDFFRARRRRLLQAICRISAWPIREQVRSVERSLRKLDARGPKW